MVSYEEFLGHVEAARENGAERIIVPIHRRLGADLLTPVSAFFQLREGARKPFLLESVEGGEMLARYSFLGRNPYMTVRADGKHTSVELSDGTVEEHESSVFRVLSDLLDRYTEVEMSDLPRLTGGAVGYFSYDCVRLIERIPQDNPSDIEVPDALWCFYDTIAAFDHVKHQLVLIASVFITDQTDLPSAYQEAAERLTDLETTFASPVRPSSEKVELKGDVESNTAQIEFERAVEAAKKYIFEGDIFQVVLSQRFSSKFSGDPFNLYRALRQVNPSPYLFYLDYEDFKLVGSSPEVLVRVEDGRAKLLPIAGTRPRGRDREEDEALAKELLADPKERAEHLMLVDLGRNDLGRISEYGSVQVESYAYIERYSHVMHIVSSLGSTLAAGRNPMNALESCFPAGTVSGAPKVRAMQIIEELEPCRRGVYAGAVGYFDFRGNMDTCIIIRTMLVTDDVVHIQAGAGIVADSIARVEYEETLSKARALHSAMKVAAGELL